MHARTQMQPVVAYGLITLSVLSGIFFVLINVADGVGPAFLQNAHNELMAAAMTGELTGKFHSGDIVAVSDPSGVSLTRYSFISGKLITAPPTPPKKTASSTPSQVPTVEPLGANGTVIGGPVWFQSEWWWNVNFGTGKAVAATAGWIPESSLTLVQAGPGGSGGKGGGGSGSTVQTRPQNQRRLLLLAQ